MSDDVDNGARIVARSGKIIRSQDARCYVDAQTLLRDAEVEAAAMIEAARVEIASQCQAGYESGRAQGQKEQLKFMAEMISRRDCYLAGAEQEICDLLLACIRTIFDGFSSADKTRIVVDKALSALRAQTQAEIRVHPNQYDAIREHLAQVASQSPHWEAFQVKPDGTIPESACIVSSEMGAVETSIEVQIQALQEAILQAVQTGTSAEDEMVE